MTNRINLFPNKTYAGYMELVSTTEDGMQTYHTHLVGGDPDNPGVVRLREGECPKNPGCNGCKLGLRQLHCVKVKL